MKKKLGELKRPIRVVLFGGGPIPDRGAMRFICQLEEHAEIEFLAAFCQSAAQTPWAVARDLWRRRRFLALPLLLAQVAETIGHYLSQPRAELGLNRKLTRLSDRIHFVTDIHDVEVLDRVSSLKPDLGLIYGSPILRPELFELPSFGTLGIHHGKVPEYRGKKTVFWAMFNGEEAAGVTIQKVGTGLDTGNVVKAGEVLIARKSRRTVWQEIEDLGLELYLQAVLEVKRGIATFRPQRGARGKLYRDPTLTDLVRFQLRRLRKR